MRDQEAIAKATPLIEAGKFEAALDVLRRALDKEPSNRLLTMRVVRVLQRLSRFDQAIFLLDRTLRSRPLDGELWALAGETELRREGWEAALERYKRAESLQPTEVDHKRSQCVALFRLGRHSEALARARALYESSPSDLRTLTLYASFLDIMGDLDEMLSVLGRAIAKSPNDPVLAQAVLLPLTRKHGVDPSVVFQHHLHMGRLIANIVRPDPRPHDNVPDPDRLLRVGYVSQDFRNRSAGHFIEPILTHHDKSRFHVTCYHNTISEDELTARLRRAVDSWVDVAPMDDRKMAERVREDGIDIFVDLTGHTGMGRIIPFAAKPAPVQYNYMGYPNTTGLATIDYRVVDWHTDPAGSEHLASETLVRMDGCFLCYTPPHHAPPVAPAPEPEKGHLTFGSFNTLTKVSRHVLSVWARILHDNPGSRLLLKAQALATPETQERTYADLASFDIPRERVDLRGETKGKDAHMATYAELDIALDPWPYNGTTTTVEAMYMGVPVVTIAGNSHVSRVGVSLLTNVGLPDLIAADEESYVATVNALAKDRTRRLSLRTNLRSMVEKSVLCDHAGFTRRLEADYRRAWHAWCEKKRANPGL